MSRSIPPKIRIVGKKVTKQSYMQLKVFENYVDGPESEEIRRSLLNSFFALESLVIYHDDLVKEEIRRRMYKRKK